MKQLFYIFTLLLLAASCHVGDDEADSGRTYHVTGTLQVDSTVVLDHLVLYADSHVALHADSVMLSPQQTFSHEGRSVGFDELYLCSDGGELCRFYAAGGMDVELSLQSQSGDLSVTFTPTEGDTINPWMTEQNARFAAMSQSDRRATIDSLCHQYPADVRTTLLLRDQIGALGDSVFVRRCLGALADKAKPEWLVKSIVQILTETKAAERDLRRLPNFSFQVNDSTSFDMSASRSDYLLIFCWADYSQASIDSLRAVADLLAEEYDMKRLQLLSCCLHAPDSAWWNSQIDKIDGTHTYLPAGFSDPRLYQWRVRQVPSLIICDMYGNVQKRDAWGRTLRDALERVPNRSGFAHTPKTKPHGR